jgi:hypothetical protein
VPSCDSLRDGGKTASQVLNDVLRVELAAEIDQARREIAAEADDR